MDILITSVVLGTIIAWAFGLKKKHQEDIIQKRSLIRRIFDIFLWK